MVTQIRSGLDWPDGAIRWLIVVFEASAGPGGYVLRSDASPAAPLLATEGNGHATVTSDEATFTVPQAGGWVQAIAAPGTDDKLAPVVKGKAAGDLILARHDGTTFGTFNERLHPNSICMWFSTTTEPTNIRGYRNG